MTKYKPKKSLLVLGCTAIGIGLLFVSFAVAIIDSYCRYNGHVVQVSASDVGEIIHLAAALSFTTAIFAGYTAWVVFRSRSHVRDE